MEQQMKDAYKIKSTAIDSKILRLHRRSIDWKNVRHKEANKRRNIKNLSPVCSPLQELSLNATNSAKENNTPVKGNRVEDPGKKKKVKTAEDLKRELVKWKKEKELKKKLERQHQLQKPSFKVRHVDHSDQVLYSKEHGERMGPAGFVPIHIQKKPVHPERSENHRSTRGNIKKPEKQLNQGPSQNHWSAKQPVKDNNRKPAEVPKTRSKSQAPVSTSGRVTRSQSTAVKTGVTATSNIKPAPRVTRNSEKQKQKQSVQSNFASKKTVKDVNTKKNAPQNLNLENVSTYRGTSFAPEDFTFSAATILSPNSAAQFLFPQDTATTSFMDSAPKRCSTPKPACRGGSEPSFTKDCLVSLVDISKQSDISCNSLKDGKTDSTGEAIATDCSAKTEAEKANKDKSYNHLELTTLSQGSDVEPVSLAGSKEVNAVLSESKRVTRGLRRSVLGTNTHQESVVDKVTPGRTVDLNSGTLPVIANECDTDVGSNSCTTPVPCTKESSDFNQDSEPQVNAIPQRMTRSLRRSLCLSPPSESLPESSKQTPKSLKQRRKSHKSVSICDAAPVSAAALSDDEEVCDKIKTPPRRNNRRTMSAMEPFQVPSNTSLVLSASRSKRKRRKTQHDYPVNPKSPEEWVNLLKNSPMVEMNRRTPKFKPQETEPSLVFDLDLDLDIEPSQNDSHKEPVTSDASTDLSLHTSTVPNPETDAMEVSKAMAEGISSGTTTEAKQESTSVIGEEPLKSEEHDVKYFRQLMVKETDTFNDLCSTWEKINNSTPDLTEDVEGQIRTCIGKAQLLIDQRFKQFTGLVDNCEFRTGEKETTCTDLQGFWDMIYIQVEDVHAMFAKLDQLKANNWVENRPEVKKKVIKKKIPAKPAVKKPVTSKFAAFRAQMKKKQSVPDILCSDETAITFDGGFFKVSSPKKTPTFHCEAGSPKPKPTDSSAKSEPLQSKAITVPSVLSPSIDSSVCLTSLRTPSRKSYVPVKPSPLLQDITPQTTNKSRNSRRSVPKRLCSAKESELLNGNKENDKVDDDVFSDDKTFTTLEENSTEKKLPPVIITPRQNTPRRSLRSRKSLSVSTEPAPDSVQTDQGSDFLKYLQPTTEEVTSSSSMVSALDSDEDDWDLSAALAHAPAVKCPSASRRRSSSLKQLPSKDRRRSTRRSVHFSASPSTENILHKSISADTPVDDILLFTPPGQPSTSQFDDEETCFTSINAGATPGCNNGRPSLLYTPEHNPTSNSTTTEVPTDILISFSP